MQRYVNTFATPTGRPVVGGEVTVYQFPGNVLATLYSDDGVTPTANPVITDANGLFSFYAADGRYSLSLTSTVTVALMLTDAVLLEDPQDGGAAQIEFIQAGAGATARTVQDKERDTIASEDYFLASESTQDAQLQRAITYALENGKHRVTMNSPHVLAGPVVIASNSNPLIVDGNGSLVTLASNTAGFIIKGLRHRLRCIDFIQTDLQLTPLAVNITTDASYTNTQHTILEFLRGVNVYRGIQATMPSADKPCYRTSVINCEFENYNLQKTWAGSFGYSFDGPVPGDAAGNDSKIIGGLVKGYENNVIVQNSSGMTISNLSNDLGMTAVKYDGGQLLRILGGYYEYNDTFISAVNSPFGLYFQSATVSNYVNFMSGSLSGIISGVPPIGGFSGGGVDIVAAGWKATSGGVSEAYATNGVKVGDLAGIGNVAAVKGIYTANSTNSFGSIAAGGNANTGAISVPGATANSMVSVTCINASLPNGSLNFLGSPGLNTVTVFCQNVANGAITADNCQLRITVIEF